MSSTILPSDRYHLEDCLRPRSQYCGAEGGKMMEVFRISHPRLRVRAQSGPELAMRPTGADLDQKPAQKVQANVSSMHSHHVVFMPLTISAELFRGMRRAGRRCREELASRKDIKESRNLAVRSHPQRSPISSFIYQVNQITTQHEDLPTSRLRRPPSSLPRHSRCGPHHG